MNTTDIQDTNAMLTDRIFTGSKTAVLRFNNQQQVIDANPLAIEWLGGHQAHQIILRDNWLAERELFLSDRHFKSLSIDALLNQTLQDAYVGISGPLGVRWLQHQVAPSESPDEKFLILSDVTDLMRELLEYQQKAEDANTQDLATELYNRRYAMARLDQMQQHAKRYQSTYSIAMLDIDHFKRINDTFGHRFGDEVLVRLAKVIKRNFRETDLCARYGGEEFLVLMPETDAHDAILTLDRLRQQISELKWDEIRRPITISCGIVEWQANKSIEQLMFQADQRLLTAKNAGRNQVCGNLS